MTLMTNSTSSSPTKSVRTESLIALPACLTLLLAVIAIWQSEQKSESPQPRPVALSSHYSVDVNRCAECHSDITDGFAEAPHSRTLHKATEPEILARFSGQTFKNPETGVEYQYHTREGKLFATCSGFARDIPVDWVFGSGTHAQTPLLVWSNQNGGAAAIEHAVSWYPEHGLGKTLGVDEVKSTYGHLVMGIPRSAVETINCFGCHTTHLSAQGSHLETSDIHLGVSCTRCHWDTQKHLSDVDAGRETTIERFSDLSPLESIDRCGECHRRADEMEGEIRPDNATLVRFASVGLVQTPCFLQQAEMKTPQGEPIRFDCTSCHDPHRPTAEDWKVHTAVCNSCHTGKEQAASHCPQAMSTENCLKCHMPKVPANDFLEFTDHWIRVRTAVQD